jgi:HlyD family secretion protein
MSTADTTSLDSSVRTEQPPAKEALAKATAVPKPQPRKKKHLGWLVVLACIVAAGGAGGWYWWQQQLHALPPGIAKANGRLEAEQVQIATKYAGRIAEVLAREGNMVDAGQVVARMDTVELEAQLAAAEADVQQAEHEKVQAEALIAQRKSERTFALQELERAAKLKETGYGTVEKLDQRRNEMTTAEAAYDAAVASLEAAKAKILAGRAEVARLKSQIDDSELIAPSRGRIQYKLAQPEEVLAAGGRVFTLLDLSEVYLTIFVPAQVAGPLAIGDEARVVLDPMPGYVFPANITFVATEAQFTPKTVETAEEREKLMFRVKLTIDPALRGRYENQVKTGLRGVGFVRTDPNTPWPDNLTVKLP